MLKPQNIGSSSGLVFTAGARGGCQTIDTFLSHQNLSFLPSFFLHPTSTAATFFPSTDDVVFLSLNIVTYIRFVAFSLFILY
jgi:hypothetical protein